MASTAGTADAAAGVQGDAAGSQPVPRLRHVDGLRALAAAYVVCQHLLLTVYDPGSGRSPTATAARWTGWMAYGNYAVTVFMVVSGFSLTVAVMAGRGERRRRYLPFMWDRSRRLLPAYWAALALAVLLAVTLLDEPRGTVWDRVLPASVEAVGTQAVLLHDAHTVRLSNYAFWSIAVEYHVYLTFPLLLWLWLRRGIPLWLLVALVSVGAYSAVYTGTAMRFYPHYYAFFALGVAACALALRPPAWCARVPWHLLGVGLAGAVVAVNWHLGVARTFAEYPYTHAVVALAAASWVVGGAVAPGAAMSRGLSVGWLTAVGGFSYSLYLIHAPLLELLWRYLVDPLGLTGVPALFLLAAGALCGVLPLAYAWFVAFERPYLRSVSHRRVSRFCH